VAQGEGPEFKSQYYNKERKKEKKNTCTNSSALNIKQSQLTFIPEG
jgi:hypothetical protein